MSRRPGGPQGRAAGGPEGTGSHRTHARTAPLPNRRVTPFRHLPRARHHTTTPNDNPPRIWSDRRSEVVQRLLADACEQCGSTDQVEVHHVRALKDLNPKGRKNPSGRRGWPPAAARSLSSAAPAVRTSTSDVPTRHPTMSTGQPHATETGHIRFGGGPSEQALPSRDLVGGLPDRTPGSEGGCTEKARVHAA
jgi:AI2M/AI1M-like, HNH endonuclease